MIYLFEFTFELFNIKSHLAKWCKEHKIDYITGHLGNFYADVYGTGEYYYLKTESLGDNKFEVYADKTDSIINNGEFKRMYPQRQTAILIESPVRKVELIMADGGKNILTDVMMSSLEAKRNLIGRFYSRGNDSISRVVDVKIVA